MVVAQSLRLKSGLEIACDGIDLLEIEDKTRNGNVFFELRIERKLNKKEIVIGNPDRKR